MAELKTRPNRRSVARFLAGVQDPRRRTDAETVLALMQAVTGAPPRMWGESIVGFGTFQYTYRSGRSGEWFLAGFSPRKDNLTLYIMAGFDGQDDLLARLGRHRTGRSCLYLKRLEDVDLDVLRSLVERSVASIRRGLGGRDA